MKQTITHRFLRYLILIIISSNLLVAIFLYGIMRENAMRQARDMRQESDGIKSDHDAAVF